MDLKEISLEDMKWIRLVQNTYKWQCAVGTVIKICVQRNVIFFSLRNYWLPKKDSDPWS